ncbi:hypothetical protein Tco_0190141 [Tanacetum coccineum]
MVSVKPNEKVDSKSKDIKVKAVVEVCGEKVYGRMGEMNGVWDTRMREEGTRGYHDDVGLEDASAIEDASAVEDATTVEDVSAMEDTSTVKDTSTSTSAKRKTKAVQKRRGRS